MTNKIQISVNGNIINTEIDENKTLLEHLLENDIKIKSNCNGNCACGTCHIKLDQEHYDKLEVSDDEQDVLERQMNLTNTSRLACQLNLTQDLDNAEITVMN